MIDWLVGWLVDRERESVVYAENVLALFLSKVKYVLGNVHLTCIAVKEEIYNVLVCVYVYECVCVFTCVACACVSVCALTYAYIYIYIYIHTHTQICVGVCVGVPT